MKLKIMKLINSNKNWRDILSKPPYNLSIKDDGRYTIIKYNQLFSDFKEPIVREARGLIIKKSGYATDSRYVDKIVDIIKRHNLTQYDTLYTIQCGAYSIEANAIAEVKRLNKLFKTNQFYIDYSDYYRVYYNKTHSKNHCLEWLNANRNILPKGSFLKEI